MTLLTDSQFIQMRDSGKFSTTFKGVHTVFEYVGSIKKHVSKNTEGRISSNKENSHLEKVVRDRPISLFWSWELKPQNTLQDAF